MEEDFKSKLMDKFAEDERLEQMNAQRRRMKEQEHKREVEKIWQEKLAVYRAQREMELEEKRLQEEDERRQQMIIEMEKQKLLEMHGSVLKQYNPKAATGYGALGQQW